jgi:VIT1/CCC1 family predicted Fe2+/Mn2+ transporter
VEKLAFNIGEQLWLKENQGIAGKDAYQSLGGFISAILPNVYVIAGIIAFILVLVAGLMFIANAGKGESEQAKKWQGILTVSIAGLLIIFLSYWIIQIIEVITGLNIFQPQF